MDAQTRKNLAILHFREGFNLFETYIKDANPPAIRHFEEATKWDPENAGAAAWKAYATAEGGRQNWTDDPSATLKLALDLAEQAVRMAPDACITHWTLASVKMISPSPGDFADAWQHYLKAEKLMGEDIDPILRAEFLAERSEYISCRGDPDEAIKDIVVAKGLDPEHFSQWFNWLEAFAWYQKGEYATASGLLQSVSYIGKGISNIAYILMAICEAYLGRPIPRDEVIARLQIKDQGWAVEKIERLPFQKKEDRDRFQKGLELANLIP